MKKKVTIIIQSRLNSSRLPNKVLKPLEGINLTYLLFERIKKTKLADDIVFSIPNTKINDKLYFYIHKRLSCKVFRGSEKNVLSRFYETAEKFKSSTVVRITGDCPFLDHNIIDKFTRVFLNFSGFMNFTTNRVYHIFLFLFSNKRYIFLLQL